MKSVLVPLQKEKHTETIDTRSTRNNLAWGGVRWGRACPGLGVRGWASSWVYKSKESCSDLHSTATVELEVISSCETTANRHHEVDGGSLALPPALGGIFGQVRLENGFRLGEPQSGNLEPGAYGGVRSPGMGIPAGCGC